MLNRKFIVAALLLAFFGQTFAASLSCSTNNSTEKQKTHQKMMDHNMPLSKMMMDHQKTKKPDCCDNDCSCPVSACSSFSIITNGTVYIAPGTNHQKIGQPPGFVLQPDITSLFRPPIIS